MVLNKTSQQLALDAVSYARQLEFILATCNEDGSYKSKADEAVSMIDVPATALGGHISTPSVPITIKEIFILVASRDIDEVERKRVAVLLNEASGILEKISKADNPNSGYTTSAGNIIESSALALPEIKTALDKISKLEMA